MARPSTSPLPLPFMLPPDPNNLRGLERAVWTLRNALYVVQHVWPFVLVLVVPVVVGGALLFQSALPAPSIVGPPMAAPPAAVSQSGSAWGGGGPAPASLLVDSTPAGATVIIDGDSVGTTPIRVEVERAGAYHLSLRHAGFAPADTLVDVDPAARVAVQLRLRATGAEPRMAAEVVTIAAPAPAPAPASARETAGAAPAAPRPTPPVPVANGSVDVSVYPWGTISIDGVVRRRDTDVSFQESLPPGAYRIRAEHPALGAREQTVQVQPGRATRVTFDLNAGSGAAP